MFARTARLTLRPGWPEDAPALFDAIAHEAVATRLAHVPWPYRIDHARDWLAPDAAATGASTYRMLILAHDRGPSPVLIGGIGLRHEGGKRGHAAELGYWLTPAAWGRGYATEAGRQVVAIARDALGYRRLVAHHHLDNPASGRVLRKLGFRESGRAARPSLARRAIVDSAAYALDLDSDGGDRPAMPLAA
ncbi:Protein N-acetyltransferase, RimJ/RimL family [Sphingomonas gellani]|uniref:Protein N-acetyltransferase, RimJ/RimL family n=1 Tax=Sphingomonas gellani TaxID=1166340 RepID=A0A1H8FK58_9SPHN|nr:GNAT family N-acetyltransferase [Sphingomonas gellani]SEN32261.1 Protein N-acetyltransferase, RimJ/RimL family [Sphingomonas gellani]